MNRPSVDMHLGLWEGCKCRLYERRFENFVILSGACRLFLLIQAGLGLSRRFGKFPPSASQAEQRIVQVGSETLVNSTAQLEFQSGRGIANQAHDIVERGSHIGMATLVKRLDQRFEIGRVA